MFNSSKTLAAAAFVAAAAFGHQAAAHGVETKTVDLPPISSGATHEVSITCSHHHKVMSGGVKAGKRMAPNGPLEVSGSYPKNTRTWVIELTNSSGRPTGAPEASVTVYAMCGYRH